MKRVINSGLPFEVIHTKMPAGPGQPAVDTRILRFVDDNGATLLDFVFAVEDWDRLVEMGKPEAGDEPLKGFEVVRAMPEVLRRPGS